MRRQKSYCLATRTICLLFVVVLNLFLAPPSIKVSAVSGDLLGTLATPVHCTSSPNNLGNSVAFDGTYLYYGCHLDPILYKVRLPLGSIFRSNPSVPIPGTLVGALNTGLAGGIGALAWDPGRKRLWAGTLDGSRDIYLIDVATGAKTYQFDAPTGNYNFHDGLAYDGSNDTLWFSDDIANTIYHLNTNGTVIGTISVSFSNSGLAVGGSELYAGSDGAGTIYKLDKASGAVLGVFASPGGRDEDMECDDITFAGVNAIWSKDAYTDLIYAFEIPAGSCNTGGTGHQLSDVPDYKQYSQPWADDPYDWELVNNVKVSRINSTIRGSGCFITSAVDIIRYWGITTAVNGQSVDPRSINDYLSQLGSKGYEKGGAVWAGIQSYTGGQIAMSQLTPITGQTKAQAIDAQLALNQPVMVGVPYNGNTDGHWVVIVGTKVNGHYPIRDPGGSQATDLGPYGDENAIGRMILLQPANGFRPQQRIVAHSPIELLITDPLGRRTGYDATSQSILNEIPEASYVVEYPIVDQLTGQPVGEAEKALYLPQPEAGYYTLQAIGTGTGSYILDFQTVDETGTFLSQSVEGTAESGSVTNYQYRYAGQAISLWSLFLPLVSQNYSSGSSGFNSQFNGSADGWEPHWGTWSIASNAWYTTAGLANAWASTSYAMNFTNFDYQARLWRYGCDCSNYLAIRGAPNPMSADKSWYSHYIFIYTRSGSYSVWKTVAGGSYIALQNWATSSAINKNDAWNTLRVVADGSNLYFYINGILVWTGSDSSLTSGRVGIGMFRNSTSTGDQLYVDWATLSTSGISGLDAINDIVSPEQQTLNDEANQHREISSVAQPAP